MSDTKVDMPKVTQMLDAGWNVHLYKGGMGSYEAEGYHCNGRVRDRVAQKLRESFNKSWAGSKDPMHYKEEFDWTEDERLHTDDFTPEQALTRLAYKVHGEIL